MKKNKRSYRREHRRASEERKRKFWSRLMPTYQEFITTINKPKEQ